MSAQSWKLAAGCVGLVVALSGCGGGGGGGGSDAPAASSGTTTGGGSSGPAPAVPAAAAVVIEFGVKQLQLSWAPVTGATSYRVLEATNGTDNFAQIGELSSTQTSYNRDIAVHQQNWSAARYQVQACNTDGCSTSPTQSAVDGALKTIGYFKASNTTASDTFGWVLALSGDGKTLAVGAPGEAKNANGVQVGATFDQAGAVYVFARGADKWEQQAYLKSANTQMGATFGETLALSQDGNTLVVGAPLEDGSALNDSGAAYVFSRSSSTWAAPARLTAVTPAADAYFGWATAISRDGKTIAIGATGASANAGAVYIFTPTSNTWTQKAQLVAGNAGAGDNFGTSVALNGDGTVLAIGAPLEAGSATGVGGTSNDSATGAGAAYLFTGGGASWDAGLYIKASNSGSGDNFGTAVTLDNAGTTLAVGAPYEASNAAVVNADATQQADNSAALSGAAYVFKKETGTWAQKAYIKAKNTTVGDKDNFGTALALGNAGDWLVVGAIGESSKATGIGGDQGNNDSEGSGAAYIFTLAGSIWSQTTYIKPATTQAGSEFGSTFGVSADTRTLAIGATFEKSAAKNIGGDQTNTTALDAGAVWLY